MNAMSLISVSATPAATGAGDSPDRMLSSHSNAVVSINRTSAGTASPSESRITSPGTRLVTLASTNVPSRRTTAVWWTSECNAAAAFSARYSLKNPSPTLAARMTAMITASVRSPRKYDAAAVTTSRISTAFWNWRPSTAQALTRWVRMTLDPNRAKRFAACALDNPAAEVSSHPSTCSTGAAATASAVSASEIAPLDGVDVVDMPGPSL